jgi:pimeloyl-ACP methyl ester carboxylesterase
VPDAVLRNFLLQNLVKTDAGFAWRVNLEALAANMDEILGFPTPAADTAYVGPTLFIAGGRSRYVQPEHRPLIQRLFPKSEHVVIAGAGHWLHAERPAEFLAHLRKFLA